jgi:hypothetical protein
MSYPFRIVARTLLSVSAIVVAASAAGCKPNRGAETVDCTPGASIWIGCNQACELGTCSGDPWLRICDGDTAIADCDDDALIAENDDSTEICFSTCPMVQMVCPPSGHVTVTVRSYSGMSTAYSCDWRVEERDPRTLRDAGESDGGGA